MVAVVGGTGERNIGGVNNSTIPHVRTCVEMHLYMCHIQKLCAAYQGSEYMDIPTCIHSLKVCIIV